jgi:RHS repeat-associated protein
LSYITDDSNKLRYAFGRDVDGKLVTMTDHTGSTPKVYYYVLNYRGDVTAMLDVSGNTVATYSYDSFGQVLNQSGSGKTSDNKPLYSENPFKYASYFHDQETNYYYLMARYYDPAQGRFLTRDLVPSSNLYAYADSNPVSNVDTNGMAPKACVLLNGNKLIQQNVADAKKHMYDVSYFYKTVNYGARLDYKAFYTGYALFDGSYMSIEDFGNFNYGVYGKALGLSDDLLLTAAGLAQIKAGTSSPKFQNSNYDDPRDQEMIKKGIAYYKKHYGKNAYEIPSPIKKVPTAAYKSWQYWTLSKLGYKIYRMF